MDGVAADLVTVLARVAVGFVRDPVQRKLRVHSLFGQDELHPAFLCIRLQGCRKRVLPGQFGAKPRRPFQLLCALFQCGLLLPQNIPQRCIARQHGPDDRKRHIQHPQHPDEPEGADILFCVVAVIVAGQPGRVQKSLFFIEADIRGGHPALFRSLFDVHLLHLRTHITP